MLESAIERPFAAAVTKAGGMCVKLQMTGIAGIPDRMVLLPGGRMLFVEFKSPTGRLSARQRVVTAHLRGLGYRVEIISSKDAANQLLKELLNHD